MGTGFSVDGALVNSDGLDIMDVVDVDADCVLVPLPLLAVAIDADNMLAARENCSSAVCPDVLTVSPLPNGLVVRPSGLGGMLVALKMGQRLWSGDVPQLAVVVSWRGEVGKEPWTGLRRGEEGDADTCLPP